MKTAKRLIAILLVMLLSFSIVSVGAQAVSVSTTEADYGYMIPTNYNFTKALSTVYLYGNYDYINFYINSECNGRYFFFEIYSDPAYTKPVYSDYTYCDQYGTYTYTPYIKLLGTFSSGTYYCLTYSAYVDENNDYIAVSEPSLASFKLVVNRLPKYNQQVVGLRSVTNTADGPKVSWYGLSSTTQYYIYRRNYNDTSWKLVGSVSGSNYTFTDKSIKDTTGTYVYTVRGQDKNRTLTRYHYSGISVKYTPAPVINSVKVNADNVVEVKWSHPERDKRGYTIYSVYRKENNGNWVRIFIDDFSPTQERVCYDRAVKSGNHYQYTVRVNVFIDNGYAFSSYNEGKSIDYIEAPVLNPMQFTEDGMTVSWTAAEGAKKYAIYRKSLEANSTWKILGRVDGSETSYIDKTAVEDGAYRYTVRSEGATNQGSYKSEGVCYVNLTEPEVKVTNVYSDCLRLQWNKSEYADYYYLMCNDGSGWKTSYGTTGYVNFFYYSQNECKEYQFSVMPMVGKHHGTYKTDVDSVVTFPSFHINSLVYNDYIRLSWKSIKADSYNVYRKLKDAPDSDYELLANVTNTAYSDFSVEENVAYTYCIRAVYHSVEQNMNIPHKNITKYSVDKYIKAFRAVRVDYEDSTGNSWFDYEFEIEKTSEGENFNTVVYALGTNGWVNANSYSFDPKTFTFATDEPTFFVVAYDDYGRTPMEACSSVVEIEQCARPKMHLNATKDGVKVSWEAVDGAVGYRVEELTNKICKTVDSNTFALTINASELKNTEDLQWCVSTVGSNGNIAGVRLDGYTYREIPKVLAVKTGTGGNTIYWKSKSYRNHVFHVFRKAPGQKNWTRVGYYTGDHFKDKTAVSGVKYMYTVRTYDYVNRFYVSYYDTVGLQVGKIATPELYSASNSGDGVKVIWERNYAADGYYVYRKTAGSGWIKLATINNSDYAYYTDYTAKKGVTYYYTVRSFDDSVLSGYDSVGVKCKKS